MHCNYHFFQHLEKPLRKKLIGKELLACFSQEKDELIIGFGGKDADFFIRCSVLSSFSALYFSSQFHRAKRNSVNLWDEFLHEKVQEVAVFKNERALGLFFSKDKCIVFKMFGNRANVLAFDGQKVAHIFNHKLKADLRFCLSDLSKEIKQDYQAFTSAAGEAFKLFPTWGKLINITFDSLKTRNISNDWEIVEGIKSQLESGIFYIVRYHNNIFLSLIKIGSILEEFTDAIEAANTFYILKLKTLQKEQEKNAISRKIANDLKVNEQYIKKANYRLIALQNAVGNQDKGHLLMANLGQIAANSTFIELIDFSGLKSVAIKLKKELSIQKNAENYYRKAKQEKIEIDFLERNIGKRKSEIVLLKDALANLNEQNTLRDIRNFSKSNEVIKSDKKEKTSKDLFKHFEFLGYQILVGKNAKNNDLLTLKFASKNDLWLHAKDVSGSHVIIKDHAGKRTPEAVIENAAGLAAWYSKRKTDSLIPVICTPKKFVRKRKGSLPGQVIVEKEEVVLVSSLDPKNFPS